MNNGKNPEHKEGEVAKTIEDQTAKIPSDVYLWAPFLLLGLYNKLVKSEGHE